MIRKILILSMVLLFTASWLCMAQTTIPFDKIIPIEELSQHLKPEIHARISKDRYVRTQDLATYFRTQFQDRFFYDWQTVDSRFVQYNKLYRNEASHKERASDHMSKFQASAKWLLPFNYQNGEAVDAYALRHLARQHKMVDIAYMYFYSDKDPVYIQYFTDQMKSLNKAFSDGKYERIKDGNGVYEVYRSGYRVLNWLSIHNLFLGEASYTDKDQLYTIATLLHHASHLYEHNEEFHSGNHQTRGMSALAMLSILFRDFKDADLWYERAMQILGEHLDKEINDDGFQFERSVHYHLSDIANYFYVYQLANISEIKVEKQWEDRLKTLFQTLVKIAYPDKSAPVLQDDTDDPWAEKNKISGALTLGYVLFKDPQFGYFARNTVEDRMYWFLSKEQLESLGKAASKKPSYPSLYFPQTGYYIMREGWESNDKMMVITAGLDEQKPDHQHGDMLGIQAMANGNVLLPNYQVRYSLEDFRWFKNSMVKNVALVDDQLQGKEWTSNKGGSGFGKFKVLPKPIVLAWETNTEFDLFVGSHDGFENDTINYSRQVLFIKDEFWIVKDNFYADTKHDYKQVWQGHYTHAFAPKLLRSTFADGSGLDILQLKHPDAWETDGKQGKEWTVLKKSKSGDYSFISILQPFTSFESRINEEDMSKVLNWKLNEHPFHSDCDKSLSTSNIQILFGTNWVDPPGNKLWFNKEADIYMKKDSNTVIYNIGDKEIKVFLDEKKRSLLGLLKPGDKLEY